MGSDARTEREERWGRHLTAWAGSGLSQSAYCRREKLTANDFSWWKRELARRDRNAAAVPTFVPVKVAPPQAGVYGFELSLRGGRVLRFDGRVDVTTLGAVVQALEAGAGPC